MIQSRALILVVCGILAVVGVPSAQDSKLTSAPSNPGKAVQEAAQSTIHEAPKAGALEILSDTKGVDFGPYLQKLLSEVRSSWYKSIPKSTEYKKGKLAIEFKIRPDGRLADMKLVATTGDPALDRAAWGGITASNPYPPLPSEFSGPFLALRLRFFYNPDKADFNGSSAAHASPDSITPVQSAPAPEAMDQLSSSDLPKYPKKARKAKIEGSVHLDITINADGSVEDLHAKDGNPMLADAALSAIRNWRFHPIQGDGEPVAGHADVTVDFRLNPEQVRAEIVPIPASSAQ